jgi:hypothetical protein
MSYNMRRYGVVLTKGVKVAAIRCGKTRIIAPLVECDPSIFQSPSSVVTFTAVRNTKRGGYRARDVQLLKTVLKL